MKKELVDEAPTGTLGLAQVWMDECRDICEMIEAFPRTH